MTPTATQLALDGDTDLVIRRRFSHPPAQVWRALTEPALIRGEHEIARLRQRPDLVPPGAVRFRKTVEQDDRRVRRVTRHRDVQLDPGGERNAL